MGAAHRGKTVAVRQEPLEAGIDGAFVGLLVRDDALSNERIGLDDQCDRQLRRPASSRRVRDLAQPVEAASTSSL